MPEELKNAGCTFSRNRGFSVKKQGFGGLSARYQGPKRNYV
jgi:hypothetical protein